jgi:anthranilate 1,2-dioxygenase large subunit
VFGDQEIFEREQERVFRGPVWCYLALEAEVPKPGDFKSVFVGDRSVVVNRDVDGGLHAFLNRCAHRGSTVVRELQGNRQSHTCIYHHWCYDLAGNLVGVPFQRGIDGKGGMPASFERASHGLKTLKVASYRGVIFGSFDLDIEPLEDFLGAPMRAFLDTLFARPIEILGFYDSDDADQAAAEYEGTGVFDRTLSLRDPSIVEFRDEEGQGRTIDMMSVFPSVLFQRLSNTLATRQIRPRNPDEFDLYWTYFGYADDDPELRRMRTRQVNLVGPGGLISMEDGESGVGIQRAIRRERNDHSVIEMGGIGAVEEQDHLVTEVPVRGFWSNYHLLMSGDS